MRAGRSRILASHVGSEYSAFLWMTRRDANSPEPCPNSALAADKQDLHEQISKRLALVVGMCRVQQGLQFSWVTELGSSCALQSVNILTGVRTQLSKLCLAGVLSRPLLSGSALGRRLH